jgi:hypothetical protein
LRQALPFGLRGIDSTMARSSSTSTFGTTVSPRRSSSRAGGRTRKRQRAH